MVSRRPILVTGAAGFIGFHLANRLLRNGHFVVGLDSLSDYYDVLLKKARLHTLSLHEDFRFHQADIADRAKLNEVFAEYGFERIVHLAAQAGVRYSVTHPDAYVRSNLVGFVNLLEAVRSAPVTHLVYASSGSVYGAKTAPHREEDLTDWPLSLYGATKKADEVIAHAYAYLYQIPISGLRFFTVYGPWGRPDMAYFLFTRSILQERPLTLFGEGRTRRDYTFIDDAVEAIVRVLDLPPPAADGVPHRLVNVGNDRPVSTLELVSLLENLLGKKATVISAPPRPEDVPETHADVSNLQTLTGFRPNKDLKKGLEQFVGWYKNFYTEK